jgi:hypothetical protein
MGRDSRLARSSIITPTQDRQVGFDDVSKRQLANALNEQTRRFQEMRHLNQLMTKILMAAAHDPDALRARDGCLVLDKLAYDNVNNGDRISVNEEGAFIWIRHIPAGALEPEPLVHVD